jgi:hybrid cluster-associated redox disulfide protein
MVAAAMEARMAIGLDDLVDDVLRRCPATFRVFLNYKLRCIGCPIACFHSIGEACRAHDVEPDAFLSALQAADGSQVSD